MVTAPERVAKSCAKPILTELLFSGAVFRLEEVVLAEGGASAGAVAP